MKAYYTSTKLWRRVTGEYMITLTQEIKATPLGSDKKVLEYRDYEVDLMVWNQAIEVINNLHMYPEFDYCSPLLYVGPYGELAVTLAHFNLPIQEN